MKPTKQLRVRLTEAEDTAIRQAAADAGVSLNEYMRRTLLEAVKSMESTW